MLCMMKCYPDIEGLQCNVGAIPQLPPGCQKPKGKNLSILPFLIYEQSVQHYCVYIQLNRALEISFIIAKKTALRNFFSNTK